MPEQYRPEVPGTPFQTRGVRAQGAPGSGLVSWANLME